MSERVTYGEWHAIRVFREGDEWTADMLHPDCHVTFDSRGPLMDYQCGPANELREVGWASLFPDGIPEQESWWRCRTWSEKVPGLPTVGSGFSWVDVGIEIELIGEGLE